MQKILRWKITSVNYKFLITKSSKFLGYQSKKGLEGEIKIYLNNIWNWCEGDYKSFVYYLISTILVERVCIEFAFNKIRIKGRRCNKEKLGKCIPEYIVNKFMNGGER